MPLRDFDKLILHDATVHTLDDAGNTAGAVGFAGGRVSAVGSLEEVRRATPGAEERKLDGATIYPGFIDAHHHLCFAATYANYPETRCPPHRTIAIAPRPITATTSSQRRDSAGHHKPCALRPPRSRPAMKTSCHAAGLNAQGRRSG